MEEMMAKLALRPIHYASVSGGKDSLYMLNYSRYTALIDK